MENNNAIEPLPDGMVFKGVRDDMKRDNCRFDCVGYPGKTLDNHCCSLPCYYYCKHGTYNPWVQGSNKGRGGWLFTVKINDDMFKEVIMELDKYKEIGTLDECRVAVDKLAILEACDEIEEENK